MATPQDKDVKKKKGTQIKKYYKVYQKMLQKIKGLISLKTRLQKRMIKTININHQVIKMSKQNHQNILKSLNKCMERVDKLDEKGKGLLV